MTADVRQGAQPAAPQDVALDAWDGWHVLEALDASKIAQARHAFDAAHVYETPPRPESWRAALVALDLFAGALADLEQARGKLAVVDLLVPHASLAFLPVLARSRARWGTFT